MPMYSAPGQVMQNYGRRAPQQGNAAGSNGAYSPQSPSQTQRPASGAATRPIPGLASALGGAMAARPQQQQAPAQTGNRAFASWNEPGGMPAQSPTWQGPPLQAWNVSTSPVGRPTAGQNQYPPVSSYVRGLGPNRGHVQSAGQGTGHGSSYVGSDSMHFDTGNGLNVQGTGATRDSTSRMSQRGPMTLGPINGGQQSGPPMMGPATGTMNLSGALSSGNGGTTRSSSKSMSPEFNLTNPIESAQWVMDNVPGWSAASADMYDYHPERVPRDIAEGHTGTEANNGHGSGWQDSGETAYDSAATGGEDNRGVLGKLGRDAGKFASAFPSGFASGLNENELINLNTYYNNFSDIQGLKDQGQNLMDPAQQAAADAAERQAMQSGINAQRDDALRMMMGQQGRGGLVGSGASTGILNSALRAQALGEQNLAQDQYQRMLGREQLGGQLISDYGRQKYGLMGDQYTSGGDIAALLLGGGKSAAGAAGSGAQGLGSILAALAPLIAGGAAAV